MDKETKKKIALERAAKLKKKAKVKERAKEYFDSIPEDSAGEGFDNFFVGNQGEDLMNQSFNRNTHNFQGMAHEGANVEMVDDLEDYNFGVKVRDNEAALGIFYEAKRAVFEQFGYIKLKSQEINHPVREYDLVVTEDDHHLIAYAVTLKVTALAIESIGTLLAFRELGVLDAKFVNTCECPMCEAFDGKIFNVDEALEVLCNGRNLVHRGCGCTWVPIIDRTKDWRFKVDEEVWVISDISKWFNVPIELKGQLEELVSVVPILTFVDMGKFIEEHDIDTIAGFPVVMRLKATNEVCIHNGYIDGLGPLDFLRAFVEESQLEEVDDKDVFLFKGRKVYSKNGLYVDVETGEVM